MNTDYELSAIDGKPWELFADELDKLWDMNEHLSGKLDGLEIENRMLKKNLDSINSLCNVLTIGVLLAMVLGACYWLI